MIRSMSDEQILAKYGYDKENQHVCFSGCRCGGLGRSAPRPECIPSPDPMPWAGALGNYRTTVRTSAYMSFKPRPWGTFTPDPEFVRSEVNPILSAFRDDRYRVNNPTRLTAYIETIAEIWNEDATPEQVDDARRVLERLAAVYA